MVGTRAQHSVSLSWTEGRDKGGESLVRGTLSTLSVGTLSGLVEFTAVSLSLIYTTLDSFRGFHTGELITSDGTLLVNLTGLALA